MVFGDTPADKRHSAANIFDGFNLAFVPFTFYSHNRILTKLTLLAIVVLKITT
ncbi:hypothetical protein BTHERMOSOX_894 [Bathymodiolus thermophilus thioautotrophic gill symbiont]|nr:hypothetical protein BTHERMOSOX_894 [Bathymodiolus thermophilus thioautotrophic gill symbiont]